MRKRSVTLQGHPTSVSLEDQYWAEVRRMAAEAGVSVAALIMQIDAARDRENLSSALRIAVLQDLKRQIGRAP